MDLPQVDTCCFGLLPLKTGALIIGIVTFLVEILGHGYNAQYAQFYSGLFHTIFVILIILGIIASALLVFGVYYNQRQFVFFFIVIYGLLIVATIVVTVVVLIKQGSQMDYLINSVVYCIVILYCLIVVNSYYRVM